MALNGRGRGGAIRRPPLDPSIQPSRTDDEPNVATAYLAGNVSAAYRLPHILTTILGNPISFMIATRLKNLDVVDRWRPLPAVVSQAVFAVTCCALTIALRTAIDWVAPGAGPFALIFPAIMLATIFGRALCGLLTLTVLLLHVWYAVLVPRYSFVFPGADDEARTIVNALAGLCIVVFAEIVRVAFRKAAQERDERVRELDLLLKEIDHRVKNNFAMVAGLLAHQRRHLPEGPGRDALLLAEARVAGIARANSHLYAGGMSDSVDMHDYTHSLCAALQEMLSPSQSVRLHCHADQVAMPRDRAVAIGLIINELVTNSLKHAFRSGTPGVISVTLERRGTGYLLTVQDDGEGMPLDKRDGAQGQTLIKTLCEQARGTFTIMTSGNGTTCQVSLT